jgi:hypothetical protein
MCSWLTPRNLLWLRKLEMARNNSRALTYRSQPLTPGLNPYTCAQPLRQQPPGQDTYMPCYQLECTSYQP